MCVYIYIYEVQKRSKFNFNLFAKEGNTALKNIFYAIRNSKRKVFKKICRGQQILMISCSKI